VYYVLTTAEAGRLEQKRRRDSKCGPMEGSDCRARAGRTALNAPRGGVYQSFDPSMDEAGAGGS